MSFRPPKILAVLAGFAAALCAAALAPPVAQASGSSLPSWRLVPTATSTHFRGLSVVNDKVVWLGGYNGTILRTVDGGRTWHSSYPDGRKSALQFRDITAFDRDHAVAMAAGTGSDSRLYRTADGGRSWSLAYTNHNSQAFFDCMSFYGPMHGLVLSDPVNGRFRILATTDGGATWQVLPNGGMPRTLSGEYGFAASGECLTTRGRQAWFGSGGAAARIYHSNDGGLTWQVHRTPIESGPSAGIFGLAFNTRDLGIAVGGDFAKPFAHRQVAAFSQFQSPWRLASTQPSGYRSGVTFVPLRSRLGMAVAVGLDGSDVTYDAGRHWTRFGRGQFDTVMCASDASCWAAGDLGRVAELRR
jgi:photosystem II stability/assembly factor-like uncharacterized protein